MVMKYVIEAAELLDDPNVDGSKVGKVLEKYGLKPEIIRLSGDKGHTDLIKVLIPGSKGRSCCGDAPTLGIIGRLGGVGARPDRIGLVSDADGAIVALAAAMKLGSMRIKGDILPGDVIITTHICPNAPTLPHKPVPFMGSPIDLNTLIKYEVDPNMDAILSIDATKANRIVKWRGIAITPTIKEGYILKVSDCLLDILEWVTGSIPRVVPITMQDLTPYTVGVYHINSMVLPWLATDSPVVGVAITSEVPVPGCATGANNLVDLELACRFVIEVAKAFTAGECKFYDESEFKKLVEYYGSMKHLRRGFK